jgi:hypothetical protein
MTCWATTDVIQIIVQRIKNFDPRLKLILRRQSEKVAHSMNATLWPAEKAK